VGGRGPDDENHEEDKCRYNEPGGQLDQGKITVRLTKRGPSGGMKAGRKEFSILNLNF
jgi:hypothetical protein